MAYIKRYNKNPTKRPLKGWYLLQFPEKFIKPKDGYMKSFKNISDSSGIKYAVEYKSNLEKIAFKKVDLNQNVEMWTIEPFPIKYIKPTDNRYHRYYIDIVIKFKNGRVYFVEVKPLSQTKQPRKPNSTKSVSAKIAQRYKNDCMTFLINTAKWEATKMYCKDRGYFFTIWTDKQLKNK